MTRGTTTTGKCGDDNVEVPLSPLRSLKSKSGALNAHLSSRSLLIASKDRPRISSCPEVAEGEVEEEGEGVLPTASLLWDSPLLTSRPCPERRPKTIRYAFCKRFAWDSEIVLVLGKGTPCTHRGLRGRETHLPTTKWLCHAFAPFSILHRRIHENEW